MDREIASWSMHSPHGLFTCMESRPRCDWSTRPGFCFQNRKTQILSLAHRFQKGINERACTNAQFLFLDPLCQKQTWSLSRCSTAQTDRSYSGKMRMTRRWRMHGEHVSQSVRKETVHHPPSAETQRARLTGTLTGRALLVFLDFLPFV